MKKWRILIPSLMATASMLLISLIGCNKVNIEDYKVSKEDLVNIISMTGVQYLQVNAKNKGVSPGFTIGFTIEGVAWCSPTVYHATTITTADSASPYYESYVYEQSNDPVYYEISRFDPEGSFSNPEQVEKQKFITAEGCGEQILEYYNLFLSNQGELNFDSNDLCYKGEADDPDSGLYLAVEYQFFKNQLIKYNMQMKTTFVDTSSEQTFKYNEVTPDVPV